jgi:hypothetical protein
MIEIDDNDIYSDSATDLEIIQGPRLLKRLRAVIHWASNVGYNIHLRGKSLIAVHYDPESGTYYIEIPE